MVYHISLTILLLKYILIISNFFLISLWLESKLCMLSVFLLANICLIIQGMVYIGISSMVTWKIFFPIVEWSVVYMLITFCWLKVMLNYSVTTLFCLTVLPVIKRRVLKSPTIIWKVFWFFLINFCCTCIATLLLGVSTLRIFIVLRRLILFTAM